MKYGRVSIEIAHKERQSSTKKEELGDSKQKQLYLASDGKGDEYDAVHNICDKPSPISSIEQLNQHDHSVEDKTENTISANGNTLIDRDNVLLPTSNDTNYNTDTIKENIKDVSIMAMIANIHTYIGDQCFVMYRHVYRTQLNDSTRHFI